MNITKHKISDTIFTLSDILTTEECTHFITQSEKRGYVPADIHTPQGLKIIPDIRNNYRTEYHDPLLAEQLYSPLKSFFPEKIENWEIAGLNSHFRFYRYDLGEKFARHFDGSYIQSQKEKSFFSFLIYLNDQFTGGETVFTTDKIITPQTGLALCFQHHLSEKLWHESFPILSGRKYVLRTDIMYRER